MTISFARVQEYLTKISDKTVSGAGAADHGVFWSGTYAEFTTGVIPVVTCKGVPIPIIDRGHPTESAFLQILANPAGFCDHPQMPKDGPYVTDQGYTITLDDNTVVTGAQILTDLRDWLENGYHEH